MRARTSACSGHSPARIALLGAAPRRSDSSRAAGQCTREPFLDLERGLETVAAGIDGSPLRAEEQGRPRVLFGRARVRQRVERACEGAVLETEPGPPRNACRAGC